VLVLVLLLSLLAAFLFAASGFLEQRAAQTVVADQPQTVRVSGMGVLMRRLVRNRTWLMGWIVNITGFVTQAGALQLGTVAVVQPVMSTQLMFSVPLAARQLRRRPRWREIGFAGLVCAGLAVFFTVEGARQLLSSTEDRDRVMLAAASTAALVIVLAAISTRCSLEVAAHLAAVCAGLCFAISAVFTKLTTSDLIDRGVAATATDWPGYLLAVGTLAGLMLEQTAFAGGPLPWAIAAMSVTNPIASYAIGILAFHVPFPDTPGKLAGIAASGALIIAGLSGLSNSELAQSFYTRVEAVTEQTPSGASASVPGRTEDES
jgi:drug/metabolite transporter (DMT)-like permease